MVGGPAAAAALFLVTGFRGPEAPHRTNHAEGRGFGGGVPAANRPLPQPDEPPIAWATLAELPSDLAAVRRASGLDSNAERRTALAALADDETLADRARGAASFRLGREALRRGRWTEATARLTAPELEATALRADALQVLAEALPGARRGEAIALLERLLREHPDYRRLHAVRLLLGERLAAAGRREESLPHFEAVAAEGSFELRGNALARRAAARERLGRSEEAARDLETLYYGMPTHGESLAAGQRLSKLYRGPQVEAPAAAERYPRAMERAAGFASAGRHRRAHENYREIAGRFAAAADTELVRLRIGIEEFHRGRLSASLRTLSRITREDLVPAALYYRGESYRRLERRTTQSRVLEELLALETEHPYGARALYSLARARLAQNDREAALPYLRRLADEFPHAPRGLFARWHDLWDRYRNGETGIGPALEGVARENPGDFQAGQFLYFAGRAYEREDRAREAAARYREVVLGYRNSFYGRRAAERLAAGRPGAAAVENPIAEPEHLLDRFRIHRRRDFARVEELYAAGYAERARAAARATARDDHADSAAFHALESWLLAQAERNVPSIQAMQRAAPFHTSAAGDALPPEYWRLLFPLRYTDGVREQAARRELDPYLVAGLIRQESAFAPRTRSPVGARGLMQIMPGTGRALARVEGLRWRLSRLYDPGVNIRFGTRYLRQLLDEFGGRPDYALAGYNAGPHRVRRWTGMDLEIASEQFIEEIPFTETRNYVKLVLRNEMLYRRLYPELAGNDETATPGSE